jgi:tRNA-binding EMAP/Myf-like protein
MLVASHILIAEPDPESEEILVFSVTTRCKRLIVKVGDKEVVVERQRDKLIVRKDGAYTTKRVTLKYPKEKPYLFYTKREDGTVIIEAEALY